MTQLMASSSPAPSPAPGLTDEELTSKIEPFDSFWEGPEDVAAGYARFYQFYSHNYVKRLRVAKEAPILVVSCGPGYLVETLQRHGYTNVLGIDSFPDKISHAVERGLNCRCERLLAHLDTIPAGYYHAIICEQELNHLTKPEILHVLGRLRAVLKDGGSLIVHALNGANPITGAEALAQNFDHHNTFTEYTFQQLLTHTGFKSPSVFGLHLYVFYRNPANYVAWAISSSLFLLFRALFVIFGKSNKLFHKKIAAVCYK